MKLSRRLLVRLAPLLAMPFLPKPASAVPPIPVFDYARFVEMIEVLKQMEAVYTQLRSGMQALEDATKFLGRGYVVDDILLGHQLITQNVRTIGYRIETVSRQFEALFPDEEAVQNTDPADLANVTRDWDEEIHQSALAASRAQSVLSRIERNTAWAEESLQQSQLATREDRGSLVAKLQAMLHLIGVVNSDLNALATTLAATERVNTGIAAAAASESELSLLRRRNFVSRYAREPSTIPALDRRFLR